MTQQEKIDLAMENLDWYEAEIKRAIAIIRKITWKNKPTTDDMKELIEVQKILEGIV